MRPTQAARYGCADATGCIAPADPRRRLPRSARRRCTRANTHTFASADACAQQPEPHSDPVAGLTIADLRARDFGAGAIEIGSVYRRGGGYTTYRISYLVDGLKLTGLLHVPDGDGPFPVIIANRGHIDSNVTSRHG